MFQGWQTTHVQVARLATSWLVNRDARSSVQHTAFALSFALHPDPQCAVRLPTLPTRSPPACPPCTRAVQGEPPAKRQALDPQQQHTQQQAAMGSFQQYALQPAQQVQQPAQPQFGLQQQLLAGGAAGLAAAAGNTNMTSLLAQLQQRVSWEELWATRSWAVWRVGRAAVMPIQRTARLRRLQGEPEAVVALVGARPA